MFRSLWRTGLAALALAGCATVAPPPVSQPERATLKDFSLEARFALRLERPYEAAPESASGRLSWQHRGATNHILVADPLGQGIAEIEQDGAGARLRTRDGRQYRAADAATLLKDATGYPLPLGELPAWLIGRPTASGQLRTDEQGRPLNLADAGWQIEYEYDSEAPAALPVRLTLRRGSSPELRSLELRLRIEEWRSNP
ncbi:MAG TPA: lipoprotein insertase outer membrane protein LolB [Rhodocyclaceae bacterium]|nr:lipoprotein insertase outer membrane protein LolB [Rhodocyclaceae bacterium]